MTTTIYFVTPRSLVKIGSKAAEFIPVLGPQLQFAKKAQKVTEMTNPVSASSRAIGILFNYCFGKAGATSVECIFWLGFSIVGGVSCNPTLIAVGAEFGNMVIDEIIG